MHLIWFLFLMGRRKEPRYHTFLGRSVLVLSRSWYNILGLVGFVCCLFFFLIPKWNLDDAVLYHSQVCTSYRSIQIVTVYTDHKCYANYVQPVFHLSVWPSSIPCCWAAPCRHLHGDKFVLAPSSQEGEWFSPLLCSSLLLSSVSLCEFSVVPNILISFLCTQSLALLWPVETKVFQMTS